MSTNPHTTTLFVTGLRAWAALGVFISHFGLFYDFKSQSIYNLTSFGHNGVILFFLISSFTIALSLSRSQDQPFTKYLTKRFLRIAPLLYVVSIYGFLFATSPWRYPHYPRFDFINLLAHFSFLNLGEINFDYQNSLIGVEWTLPIEFAYYLILPFLLTKTKSGKWMSILLISSLYLHLNSDIYSLYKSSHNLVGFHWSLQKYFFVYVLGLFAYYSIYSKKYSLHALTKPKSFLFFLSTISVITLLIFMSVVPGERPYFAGLLFLFVFLVFAQPTLYATFKNKVARAVLKNSGIVYLLALMTAYGLEKQAHESLFIALWAYLLVVCCHYRGGMVQIFENRFAIFLGTISYSFYLLQFPVHDILLRKLNLGGNTALFWILLLGVLIGVSTLTYNFIEKRFTYSTPPPLKNKT